jgi:hypothetical protein
LHIAAFLELLLGNLHRERKPFAAGVTKNFRNKIILKRAIRLNAVNVKNERFKFLSRHGCDLLLLRWYQYNTISLLFQQENAYVRILKRVVRGVLTATENQKIYRRKS